MDIFKKISTDHKKDGQIKNQIISLSGGKDSTTVLLKMIERKEPIHSVIAFDTGWEFPEMHAHLDLLEKRTGIKIWRLHSHLPFDYWMTERPITGRSGKMKDRIGQVEYGYGWPSYLGRWCTKIKVATIKRYLAPIENVVSCIGYASDELNRGVPNSDVPCRMPLQEWNMTEKDALQYCYDQGYDWGGLYEHFKRVSCYCCPLQPISELRILRNNFPELWEKMLAIEDNISRGIWYKRFKEDKTIHDFEKIFANEKQNRVKLNKLFNNK